MGNAVVYVRPQHHVFLSVLLNAHSLSVLDGFALLFGKFYHIWLLCEHLTKGQRYGQAHQSPNQLPDRAAPGHQLEGTVEAVFQFQIRGDAQTVIDCGDDIGRKDGAATGMSADLVAGAVDVAALNAAAGEHDSVAEVPVVAT